MKLRPYITEKSVKAAESGVFTLLVDFSATKGQIEQSIIDAFGFKAVEINLVKGKYRSAKKMRKTYLDRGIKKALVKLDKGQKIPGFELADATAKEEKAKKETKTKEVKEKK